MAEKQARIPADEQVVPDAVNTAAKPAPAASAATSPRETEVIPVIEEQVNVSKQTVETGRVHISKRVHTAEEIVDVPTAHEEIDVERVAVNRYVESAPEVRYEGDTTIIPVMREEAVVVKRLILVEELHVTKRIVRTHEQQQVSVRREEIDVNRETNDTDFVNQV